MGGRPVGPALYPPAGRRVPGHRPPPAPASPGLAAGGRHLFRHRRSRPVHLRLPRGGRRLLLRPGGGADGEADGELPLHPGDSRRGPAGDGGHRRRAPAHGDPQPPRGGGTPAHRRGGPGGGHLRGQGDRPDGGWHRHAGGPGAGGRPGRAELRGHRGALPYPAAGGPAGGVSDPRRHSLRGHRPGGFSVGRGGAGRAGLAGGAAGGGKSPAALLEEWTAHHTPLAGWSGCVIWRCFLGMCPPFSAI